MNTIRVKRHRQNSNKKIYVCIKNKKNMLIYKTNLKIIPEHKINKILIKMNNMSD